MRRAPRRPRGSMRGARPQARQVVACRQSPAACACMCMHCMRLHVHAPHAPTTAASACFTSCMRSLRAASACAHRPQHSACAQCLHALPVRGGCQPTLAAGGNTRQAVMDAAASVGGSTRGKALPAGGARQRHAGGRLRPGRGERGRMQAVVLDTCAAAAQLPARRSARGAAPPTPKRSFGRAAGG